MPYLGFEPTFGEYPSQIFAGTATGPNGSKTDFTMTYAPSNSASVLVTLAGVKQMTNAYSVDGTTLTMTAAPAADDPVGTNSMELVFLGLRADTIQPDETLGTDAIMRYNGNTISENITVASTQNAMSAGPITIADTYIVTVSGNWSIV